MKITKLVTVLTLAAMSIATWPASASDQQPADSGNKSMDDLNKEINSASSFYSQLQQSKDTSIPMSVINQAKGVLFLTRWSASLVVGGTSGSAIGMEKNADGKFGAPAFYNISGASIGLQAGVSKTQAIAFLMSNKAMLSLTEKKYVWSGNLRAVAGSHSSASTTVDNSADVMLYQQSSGLDVGATFAATQVFADNNSNGLFYGNISLSPEQIFAGTGLQVPDNAKALTNTLNGAIGDTSQVAQDIRARHDEEMKIKMRDQINNTQPVTPALNSPHPSADPLPLPVPSNTTPASGN